MFLYCRWLRLWWRWCWWWRWWWRGFWRGWRVNLIWKLYTNLTHPKLYTNLTQMKCKVSPVVRTVLGCCVMCKVLASTTGRYSDSEFYNLYPFHPEQIPVKEAFSQPEFWRGWRVVPNNFDWTVRQTDRRFDTYELSNPPVVRTLLGCSVEVSSRTSTTVERSYLLTSKINSLRPE
jgi:hypothetical protein